MLHQLDIFGKDKVDLAIETLKFFEPKDGSGYFLAFSGGKDSVCIKALCDMAGVKYDAHYQVTSVDPPELVRFVKKEYPDVIFEHTFYDDGTPITMWNLIPKEGLPPTRIARYCCKYLKESAGEGRITVTGVRWAESVNRMKNQGRVTIYGKTDHDGNFTKTNRGGAVLREDKAQIFLNNDNDEGREVVDFCIKQRKTVVNPIVDWEDDDVWEFIRENNIPYCSLYDEGYKRLGCIGCPMGNRKGQLQGFKRWPAYKKLYIMAFQKMVDENPGRYKNWKNGQEVFDWWIGEKYVEN